jgi:hypothetical protein
MTLASLEQHEISRGNQEGGSQRGLTMERENVALGGSLCCVRGKKYRAPA